MTRHGSVNIRALAASAVVLVAVTSTIASCGSGETDDSSLNGEVRDALEAEGVDPSSQLSYEHFFIFADEAGARAAAVELAAQFDVELMSPGDGIEDWTLIATEQAALGAGEVDALTSALETLASRHGGAYDGWGTPIGSP